ncbi:MAG: hypothetical protein IKC97_02945 [Clostridia bacterium]|nr:hypothetical protein [Clostridia bacterium]
MKKVLSLLLAFLLIVSAAITLVACMPPSDNTPGGNQGGNQGGSQGGNQGGDQGGSGDEPERIPLDYLPTDGYNGASFHIFQWTAGGLTDVGYSWVPWEEGDVEREDGDMLGSAVFDRNAWVEENFGVTITREYGSVDVVNGAPSFMSVVRSDASTSSNTYQQYILRTVNIVELVEEELFADMNKYSQYLHTDQPWWVQDSVKSFTLGAHLYVAATEMLLRDKGATAALFFNQVMASDYTSLPNFFELAEAGDWTLEELVTACEIVSHSNDSDELMNSADDIWGCCGGDDPVYYLFNAAGQKFAHIDEGGYLSYDFGYDDNSVTIMKRIFDDFIYADWYMNKMTVGANFLEKDQDLFVDGTSLFKSGMIKDTTNVLKYMPDLYGILPHPKIDVDQEEYSSLVWEHHDSILGIPEYAADKEMCAVILEALSWESYYTVYPMFYETILLSRAAKDSESKAMLQIILDTRSYDPGLYWDNASGLHGNDGLLRLSKTGSSDIASKWATYSDTIEENVQEVNNWIADKE